MGTPPFFYNDVFAFLVRSRYICENKFNTLRKLHERQKVLSVGSRRTIVGGGLVELHGPPDAFYYAGSDEIGHC